MYILYFYIIPFLYYPLFYIIPYFVNYFIAICI